MLDAIYGLLAMLSRIASVPDAMAQMPGERVELPYRVEGRIEPNTCLELRVLETGVDVELTFSADGTTNRNGVDGDVSRHGLQVLVECADEPRAFNVDIAATPANAGGSVRWTQRVWTAEAGDALPALRDFAAATARYTIAAEAGDVATKLAAAARRFDAAGDTEHAAIAWTFAYMRAEAASDRTLAAQAYDAAYARTETLNWTRYRVVLLNNRAWYLSAVDPREALKLIDAAFALQARLADPKLAATVENNVCLFRHQNGALAQAGACFQRVLERQTALKSGGDAIGATRNNVALVQLAQGRYREAEAGFRIAAQERLAGGDKSGNITSLCNLALALYQLGELEAALSQLHEAYAAAKANTDRVRAAQAASFIAAIYLVGGDAETAYAYAAEAEREFRDLRRIADRSGALRLLARIALDRDEGDAANTASREAWELAVANDLYQAASNVASVRALILVERGELAQAEAFIADARTRLAAYFGKADLASLDVVELRLLRELGRLDAARLRAQSLDKRLALPGLPRSRLLVERYLVDDTGDKPTLRRSYTALAAELRRNVVAAPDPELALRVQELARPAAEAAIARELAACTDTPACAAPSLRHALEFFSLEPRFVPHDTAGTNDLPMLLQALSQLQARDDGTAASAELIAAIKRRQATARRQRAAFDEDDCAICRQVDAGSGDLVYFFGAARGWRWQRVADGWRVVELPGWDTFAAPLRASADPSSRRDALRTLAPLVAGLAPADREALVVRGDPKLLRIPFGALPLGDDAFVVDRYAVTLVANNTRRNGAAPTGVAFAGGSEDGADALPMIEAERRLFADWAQRHALPIVDIGKERSAPLALLHLAAHGQRDVGAGLAVLWLKDAPLLSYLPPQRRLADTVVINGCDSGAAPERGLPQASIAAAFLRNGARSVVATLYPVPDRVAMNFARAFYANFDPARGDVAAAVRLAQLELRRGPNHGDAWAAYSVVVASDTIAQ